MNCNLFDEKIVAIARGELLDAEAKQEALNHTRECSDCKARLQSEEILNVRLKEFALDSIAVSPKIENTLRKAFKTNIAKPNLTVVMMPERQRGAWVIGGAIAACLLLTVGFLAQRFYTNQSSLTSVVLTSDKFVEFEKAVDEDDWKEFVVTEIPKNNDRFSPFADSRQLKRKTEKKKEIIEAETVTEFMSLTDDSTIAGLEPRQIVRVRLTRSALIALGLPIDVERADEKITADVMLSEEGIAKAIRFVHTSDD